MTLCGGDAPTDEHRVSVDDSVRRLVFLFPYLFLCYLLLANVLISRPYIVNRNVPYVCLLTMMEMNFENFPVVTFFTVLVSTNGYI